MGLGARETYVRLGVDLTLHGANMKTGRPSDAIYPLRTNSDGTRRSSVWSVGTSSPEGKRRWSWFGRKNSVSEAEEVNFGDVNLTGGDRETKD